MDKKIFLRKQKRRSHPIRVSRLTACDHLVVDFDLGKLDPCHGLKDLSEAGTPDDEAEVDDPLQNFHITVLTCILSSTCDVFHCFSSVTLRAIGN